jgi:uridine kinase
MLTKNHYVIAISGISGTGKTTLGKAFVKKYDGWILIDQDFFYLKEKPLVLLSSGETVKNWDCLNSIDWDKLNEDVNKALVKNNVLLTGFALWMSKLKFPIKFNVLLKCDDFIDECIISRRITKKLGNNEKISKDVLIVKELVAPFYLKTLAEITEVKIINIKKENTNTRKSRKN